MHNVFHQFIAKLLCDYCRERVMAMRVLSKFLRKAGIGRDSITMIDLEYATQKGSSNLGDVGQDDALSGTQVSPKLQITSEIKPQIPVIGIGGCGIRIVSQMSNRFESYGISYPLMGIDTDSNTFEKTNFTHKYQFPNTVSGTSKQYRVGATIAKQFSSEMMASVNEYLSTVLQTYKHEIVLLVIGAGGTGVGVGLELAEKLISAGKRPVPILILPGKEESPRVRFTAAAGVYKFSYGPRDQCLKLASLMISNDYFLEKNSKGKLTAVLAAVNERIGSTLTDLIMSSEMKSSGYSADLNEFLEIFRNLKGIGTISYMHSGKDFTNIVEFFDENLLKSIPIEADPYSATRGYLFIQAASGLVSSRNYRDMAMKFNNSDIFPKFDEVTEKQANFSVRGIFTGIKYPTDLEELLRSALDAKIQLLNREENNLADGRQNVKIDRLTSDEEIKVNSGGDKSQ